MEAGIIGEWYLMVCICMYYRKMNIIMVLTTISIIIKVNIYNNSSIKSAMRAMRGKQS